MRRVLLILILIIKANLFASSQTDISANYCVEYNNKCHKYKLQSSKDGVLQIETNDFILYLCNFKRGENIINNHNHYIPLIKSKEPNCAISDKKQQSYSGILSGVFNYLKYEIVGSIDLTPDSSSLTTLPRNIKFSIPLE